MKKQDPTNWHMIFWICLGVILKRLIQVGAGIALLVVALTLLIGNKAEASVMDCDSVSKLSDTQVYNVYKSYERGAKDDLGYTLAAIAWRESSLGKYRVNPTTSDYGLYHINFKTIKRIDKLDYYPAIQAAQEVVWDDDEGARYALTTLKWNLNHFKSDWRKAIAMYNGGKKWREKASYAADIAIKVRILRTCLPKGVKV